MSGFHREFKLDLPANRYKMPTKSWARGHRMNTTGLILQQLSPEKTRHIKNPMLGSRSMRKRSLGVLGEAEGAQVNFSMFQCLVPGLSMLSLKVRTLLSPAGVTLPGTVEAHTSALFSPRSRRDD